jgi:uncharacterized protein YciI
MIVFLPFRNEVYMLILSLTYKVPLEKAEAASDAHMAWVKEGYEKGVFLASGRKVPRTGGVILARGERTAIEAFCATDPFVTEDIADYEITEVAVSRTVDGLEALKS